MNIKNKKYFVLCEQEVLQNKKLTANDKLVYSFIRGFWNNGLEFTGSNSYIADSLGIHRTSVIRSIQHLAILNLVFLVYGKDNYEERTIRSFNNFKRDDGLIELFNKVYGDVKSGNSDTKK